MSIVKAKRKTHSIQRAKERLGLRKSDAQAMIKNAYRYGIAADRLKKGPIKDYLLRKQQFKNKRVKLYHNIVFIFARNSTGCETLYPLDPELIEAQKEFDKENNDEDICSH